MKNVSGKLSIIVIFLIFIVSTVFLALNLDFFENNDVYFSQYNKKLDNKLHALIKNQQTKDKKLSDIYNSDDYTIYNPYVEVNPYEISPLSAIIIFKSEESVEIDVYLNDVLVTKMSDGIRHAIPIYGLYSSGLNNVRLELSNGITKEIEIPASLYNYNLDDFDLSSVVDKKSDILLVGNIDDHLSNVRAFDHNNNLTFYLDLNYIGAYKLENNRIKVGYNSNESLKLLNLEIDYLGKIYNIESDTSKLLNESNISINGSYMFVPIKFYEKETKNYEFVNANYLEDYSNNEKIYTNEYRALLKNAKDFNETVNFSFIGDYLSWDSIYLNELVIVNKDNAYSYKYNIENLNMIRIHVKDKMMSLYGIDYEGNYYNLNTTLKVK